MKIHWEKTGPYRWSGMDEKQNYLILVDSFNNEWHWKVYRDEDKIITGDFEEDFPATKADDAKLRAENALDTYLAEQDNLSNTLYAVVTKKEAEQLAEIEAKERENHLLNELEKFDYYKD